MRRAPFSNDREAGKLLASDLERELNHVRDQRDMLEAKVSALTAQNSALRQQNEWMKISYEVDDRTVQNGVIKMAEDHDIERVIEHTLRDLQGQNAQLLRDLDRMRMYIIAMVFLLSGLVSWQYVIRDLL